MLTRSDVGLSACCMESSISSRQKAGQIYACYQGSTYPFSKVFSDILASYWRPAVVKLSPLSLLAMLTSPAQLLMYIVWRSVLHKWR